MKKSWGAGIRVWNARESHTLLPLNSGKSKKNLLKKVRHISELMLILSLGLSKRIVLNIINKHKLGKLVSKNRGNTQLIVAIKKLITNIETSNWRSPNDLTKARPDADCVHGGTFYIFNINIHRTLILIEFDENSNATIVWAGSHDDYEQTFKNNRNVIEKWLRDNSWIK